MIHDETRMTIGVRGTRFIFCLPMMAGLAFSFSAAAAQAADSAMVASLKSDVEYLAGKKLEGRAAGTAGGDSAAAFIAHRFDQLGLGGPFPSECTGEPRCGGAYFQFFEVEGKRTENVAALVPGTDAALHGEYVIVSAHYDHLGRTGRSVMDPEFRFALHPGADDNASGTAVLLELARRFSDFPAKRGVLLVAFGAEERGLFGSLIFTNRPPVAPDSIVMVVNFDMVGRLRFNTIFASDHSAPLWVKTLIDSSARMAHVKAMRNDLPPDRTDEESFIRQRIPTVGFFTGGHVDYHTALDVPARINFRGLKTVADVAELVIRGIADNPALPRPSRK